MRGDEPSGPRAEQRVISFPRSADGPKTAGDPPPTAGLDRYEHPEEDDDYRHRMLVNVGAFLFLILLISGAVWLTSSIAEMRKTQDCVLAGHRNCTPLDLGTIQPPR